MSFEIYVSPMILVLIGIAQCSLLYPQFTVMQLIGSVSVAVTDLGEDRKVFFDWGLQMNYDMPHNISSIPIWPKNGVRSFPRSSRAVHEHDFTAEDLYQGVANMLDRYGYDRSCLEQTICELSRIPFDKANGNIVTEVINFFLKPSIHRSFLAEMTHEAVHYRLAENQGYLGKSCRELYSKCIDNPLNMFTITK